MKNHQIHSAAWALIGLVSFLWSFAQAMQFSPVTGGPDSAGVARIDADTNGTLYTASGSRVFVSGDNGSNWTPASAGYVVGLSQAVADGGNLFITTAQGVRKSSDGGASYTGFNGAGAGALPNADRLSSATFEVAGGFVYTATQDPAQSFQTFVYRSPVDTPNWIDVSPTGLTSFGSLIAAGDNLCLLAQNNGVQFSSNNGDAWARAGSTNGNFNVIGKSPDGSNVYISGGSLRRSTDQCVSFSQVAGNGLIPAGGVSRDVFSLGVDSADDVYAGGNTGTLRVSTDNGANFTIANDGDLPDNTGVPIRALTGAGSAMLAGTSGGL